MALTFAFFGRMIADVRINGFKTTASEMDATGFWLEEPEAIYATLPNLNLHAGCLRDVANGQADGAASRVQLETPCPTIPRRREDIPSAKMPAQKDSRPRRCRAGADPPLSGPKDRQRDANTDQVPLPQRARTPAIR
ncbi:hypothetical protein CMUS01_04039 [Colletotrichum musicola]|uniref:Uncharacterized protein n=1 Tax=Colletotrichum musicola TaxID=2175873 RepID=A0A8H6NPE7_9PEZI|nr:hypothetical protein CMUS01_04039 [Colletotrichum musicola]